MKKKYSEIKQGEVFRFGGQNWIRLEEAGLCIMENILEQSAFDEEDKNDWRTSDLREYLNDDFYEQLLENGANEEDFKPVISDLTSDDGMKDYGTSEDNVALLTADLYRKNRSILKPLSDWWWLITPWSCLASNSCDVRCVSASGALYDNSAYNGSYGVRPLCNLSSEILVAVDGEEKKGGNRRNEYNRTYKEVGN